MYPPRGVSRLGPFTPPDTGVERGERQEGHPDSSLRHVRARRSQGTDRAATPLGLCRAPAPHRADSEAPRACGQSLGRGEGGTTLGGGRGKSQLLSLWLPSRAAWQEEVPARAWVCAASRLRSNFSTEPRSSPGARSRLARTPAHPPSPLHPPPSSLPLSSPLPVILTLLGRPMEVASWTVRAATLKSTEPVLGRASRPDPGQRPPKTCC